MSAALAADLVARAANVLPYLPHTARAVPLAALSAFVERPSASRHLAAVRALSTARRDHLLRTVGAPGMQRSFEEGIEALREVEGMPVTLIEQLARDLPVEPATGMRLRAIAFAARAYEELAGRVLEEGKRMRRWRRDDLSRRGSRRR